METNTKIGLLEKSTEELLEEILMEIGKAKEMLRILFEEELTQAEIKEFDSLTPDEEKVLRMRLGISEPLKGSLGNNIYKKDDPLTEPPKGSLDNNVYGKEGQEEL